MAKNKVLSITEIEDGLKKLILNNSDQEFITAFLGFYDIPKTSITRALAKFNQGEPFVIKNKIRYEEIEGDVVVSIDAIQHEIQDQKSKPRYIMVNNFSNIAAIDTKTGETLNVPISELPANADFFLAWNGIEKADYQAENPADRKAAERFAKLYDVVAKDNPNADEHAFNLFLIRVLFLLFAEDTGIMNKGSFTNVLKTRTLEDGSNFNTVIKELFEILDVNELARGGRESWLLEFPYVNGKLFGEPHVDLNFSKLSRDLLIEAGELLNWNEINPDILGAMIQSVASAEDRHVAGMHYTSVPNIMKVIKPLFLDELNDVFENLKAKYEDNELKDITEKTRKENKKAIVGDLHALITRISNIKFLDPASGSGNFLIIAYKEIRRLEIKILQLLEEIETDGNMPLSSIHLGNFNGIELDDFAHEVAKLSLWIAEHQMNKELEEALPGTIAELLPLKDAGNIVCGNSLRIDWNEVVSCSESSEVYVMGNPPYLGAKLQDKPGDLSIKGLKPIDTTERTKKIIENDMSDLKSSILQSQDIQNAIVSGADAKMINKTLIPRVIIERYPDLTKEELETIRQHTVADITISAGQTTKSEDGSREIIKMADRFINIDELNIDLIDQVNPFQRAYEVISRDIDAPTLRFIQDYLSSNKYEFTDEQLVAAFREAKAFRADNGRNPDRNSKDEGEKYLAFALLRLAEIKREREAAKENGE